MATPVGILVPSSNTVMEPALAAIAASDGSRVTLLHSRLRVVTIAPDSNDQFAVAPMVEAASLLADAAPAAIVWGGTSGGWRGLAADRAVTNAITAATGIPATTTTQATVELVTRRGVRSLGFATPYVPEILAGITATYAPLVEEVHTLGTGLTDNVEFARIPESEIERQVRQLAAMGCDTVAVYCTNVLFFSAIVALEQELGISILDSVAVTYWAAAGFAGDSAVPPAIGRLLY
jgi:maleate isomerase